MSGYDDWGSACGPSCGYCGACSRGSDVNAECSRCGEPFHRNRDDVGRLCDACCDLRDRLPMPAKDELYTRAVREWDRKASR